MSERKQSAAVITIDNGGLQLNELDRDLSGRKLEYRMRLVNKASGENLGNITSCTLSHLWGTYLFCVRPLIISKLNSKKSAVA